MSKQNVQDDSRLPEVAAAGVALSDLSRTRPELAAAFARVVLAVAEEASRSPRLAEALGGALQPTKRAKPSSGGVSAPRRPANRRAPGPIDPFAIYADGGEEGLRHRLGELDLEELRDIVAEHGMDNDRLAMRWKNPARVVDRIMERVVARATKGSAFRR